ncbi:MAG TPA: O-methyltransferase [Solirubrobacteraceae bacterium]|nr:O-methyltransferase [Solirubrobacteraceae bacterium]
MSWERWNEVDEYTEGLLIGHDEVLAEALRASQEGGLPPIAVTASQGRLLNLIARIHGSARILEVGTLGGYSTIWLARALPPTGRLITLELSADFAAVASANIERAGLAEFVEVRVGPAIESLQDLLSSGAAPFDLVFIDADKQSTPEYFTIALELARPGALMIVDNVVRDGAVVDAGSEDPGVQGMRRFLAMAGAEPRVTATTIQTVGGKGYDGFTMALVIA